MMPDNQERLAALTEMLQKTQTPQKALDTPSPQTTIKFGPYAGQWGDQTEIDGGKTRTQFNLDGGDTMFLDPSDENFTPWHESPTFNDEVIKYKDAFVRGDGRPGWQQNYVNDSHYPDFVYDAMVKNDFNPLKLKQYFLDNPDKVQWKQDSIPSED